MLPDQFQFVIKTNLKEDKGIKGKNSKQYHKVVSKVLRPSE